MADYGNICPLPFPPAYLSGQSRSDKKHRMLTEPPPSFPGDTLDTLTFHDSSPGCPRASTPPRAVFLAALTSLWMDATVTGSAAAGRWSKQPSKDPRPRPRHQHQYHRIAGEGCHRMSRACTAARV